MITDKDTIRMNASYILSILEPLSKKLKFFKVDGHFLQDPLDFEELGHPVDVETIGDAVEKALQYAKNIQKIT
jgi:hypothetical protein